ncbi:MAG: hypothetical protein IPH36_01440 [Saprospiraceae bacterium]|nr:hypothetical protein [Saprospiraceae bacterium]
MGKVNGTLDARQNEYDLLKSMIENFEELSGVVEVSFFPMEKNVPALSDLLDVQEEYKSVIEQYLEPYLTYFVVNDVNEAGEAIRLLGGAQKGKANFFLLNRIEFQQGTKLSIPLAKPAIECVKVEAKYEPLLSYLLRDAYIFDGSLDDFKYDREYDGLNFLSKSGSFLKTRFTISGGSVGLFEGKKIGRKKNLEKLETFIREAEEQKVKLSSELDKTRNLVVQLKGSDRSLELEHMLADLQKIEQEKTRLFVSLENLAQKIKDGETKIVRNRQQIDELEEKQRTFEVDKISLKRGLEEEEQNIRSSNSDLDHLTDRLNKASEAFNDANIEVIRQQNLLTNHLKDLEFKQSRQTEISERIKSETSRKEADIIELEQAENHKIALENELLLVYNEKIPSSQPLMRMSKIIFRQEILFQALKKKSECSTGGSTNTRLKSTN